jgi:hypothetical protein
MPGAGAAGSPLGGRAMLMVLTQLNSRASAAGCPLIPNELLMMDADLPSR